MINTIYDKKFLYQQKIDTEGGMYYPIHSAKLKERSVNFDKIINTDELEPSVIQIPEHKFEKSNCGNIGGVIFRPGLYSNEVTEPLEGQALVKLKSLLDCNVYLDDTRKKNLIYALSLGKFAFQHEIQEREILGITNQDVDLLLKYSDIINNNELMKSGKKANDKDVRAFLAQQELAFRREYFQLHSKEVTISNSENINVLRVKRNKTESDTRIIENPETSVTIGAAKWFSPNSWNSNYADKQHRMRCAGKFIGFETVKSKGVNIYTFDNKEIDLPSRILAEYGVQVAEDLSTTCQCFTGLKHTLLSAGVISDYGDIKDENGKSISEPRKAVNWFASQPEKFTEIKYVENEDGTIRELNSTDLYDLPAGYIVLWIPEEGETFAKEAGHAGTTNGNGQLNGDHPDSFRWEYFRKGEHGTVRVFKLNDKNWLFNETTKKLEYIAPDLVYDHDKSSSFKEYLA
ncbi:MAG: hypothetical protein E7Z87_02180 [Cyanobacteria bacterium SIG26]|nr:hypothetical protein [Cyanobacteria bacterium SIG26]